MLINKILKNDVLMAINPSHTVTAIRSFMAIKSNSPSRTVPRIRVVFWDEDWNRGSQATLGTWVFVTKRLETLTFGYEIISGDCWFLNTWKLFFFYVGRILPRILHRVPVVGSCQDLMRILAGISTRVVKFFHRRYSPAASILHTKFD